MGGKTSGRVNKLSKTLFPKKSHLAKKYAKKKHIKKSINDDKNASLKDKTMGDKSTLKKSTPNPLKITFKIALGF